MAITLERATGGDTPFHRLVRVWQERVPDRRGLQSRSTVCGIDAVAASARPA